MTLDAGPVRPLPAALRLAPHRSVVRLGPGARLVGLDPGTSLAVDDLPPALARMLDDLAHPTTRVEVVARAVRRGADPGEAEALLRELLAAGALVDAAQPERRARQRAAATVVVAGDGPLAVGVVVGLAQGGVGAVHVDAAGAVGDGDLGTGYLESDRGRDRAAAAATAVRRLLPAVRTGPPPPRIAPDLAVLADAVVPDPRRVAALHAAGTAHLPAVLRDGVGVVGPLVLPGRSTCLGCIDLHRRACDVVWPAVSAQLLGRRGHADPACVAATAALATAQALAALDATLGGGPAPPTLDTTLDLDAAAATVTRRTWTPSPGCGCGASLAHGVGRHGRATCAPGWERDTIDG